jgi:tRNA1(Val) A37 N6-methylase TrmN6
MDIINSKCDHIFNKKLIINQPESGYRFSVDALLLSWFAS